MYGPRKILACGYTEQEQHQLMELTGQQHFEKLPIIFARKADLKKTLAEILKSVTDSELVPELQLPKTMILSGLFEKELHEIISAYKNQQLPPALWATLTPVSETWTLKNLIRELLAERQAMSKNE